MAATTPRENTSAAIPSPATAGRTASVVAQCWKNEWPVTKQKLLAGSTLGPGLVAPNPLPLNQWSHLACVLSGTTGTIYVNGSPVVSGMLQQPRTVPRTGCYIGRSNWPRDTYANALFDEVRIWSIARRAAQILGAMRRQLPGSESGLAACYRFDDGTGLIASDTGPNGRYATLVNGPLWTGSGIRSFAPTVRTLAASAVTATTATLNGSANPNSGATTASFEWGPTTSLGNVTGAQALGSGTADVTWSTPLTGLAPGAIYYYRAVGTSSQGTSFGEVLSFH